MTDRQTLIAAPLTADAFAPFGDVLEVSGKADMIINQGLCGRYHDRAEMDFGPGGRAGISLFKAVPRRLPYRVDMVERHPHGSQAFLPMSMEPFLIVVAGDDNGTPIGLRAFVTEPGQGVNYHRNIWHGVLAPLGKTGLFAVIDRIGNSKNLEENWFDTPYVVLNPTM